MSALPVSVGLMPGPMLIDVEAGVLTAADCDLISHPLVGGVILFTRNYRCKQQLRELTASIRAARQGPLLIAVDHEGGRVQRFREEFTRIPAMRCFGDLYDTDPQAALKSCFDAAMLLAWELRECGLDFTFAPVVDIDHGCSSVIGDRALHNKATAVTELARAVTEGFSRAGCASVLKHFPGHGSVGADTHTSFAVDSRSYDEIAATDLIPFTELCGCVAAVMPAHVVYRQVDLKPASLSAVWQQQILREKLKFSGAIISDDLSMSAVADLAAPAETALAALQAGTDLVLICNNRSAVLDVINSNKLPIGDAGTVGRRLSLMASEVDAPDSTMLAQIAADLSGLAER